MPRILVVDDERQIHASLRLRIGAEYDLVYCYNAKEALERVAQERFDLCFVDIHMPDMDGLAFVEAAQGIDPQLGYVFLSAFDTDENLRRAISLRVYDFIDKPLPDRDGFEDKVPQWIERTRRARQQHVLAEHASSIAQDLHSARIEREVELVASESARDALRQTAGLLTTIHAHLMSSASWVAARAKTDSSLTHLHRSLEEARKTADAAVMVAEGFFDSAYGNRDASPALVHAGLKHAISIAMRTGHSESVGKTVDCEPVPDDLMVRGLSGIDFLLLMVPALGLALAMAEAETTIRVTYERLSRIDAASKSPRFRGFLWVNRRHALLSHPGIAIVVTATARGLSRDLAEAWLKGEATVIPSVASRGLVLGLQKAKGLLGLSKPPANTEFQAVIALPT